MLRSEPNSRARLPTAAHLATEQPGLGGLVARCLTGADVLAGDAAEAREPTQIAAGLAAAGWPPERLAHVRDARQAAGQVWPLLPSAEELGGWGLAQIHATTQQVLTELGLSPLAVVRTGGGPLSPRDRALMAERPPHHGTVG